MSDGETREGTEEEGRNSVDSRQAFVRKCEAGLTVSNEEGERETSDRQDRVAQDRSTNLGPVDHPYKGTPRTTRPCEGVEVGLIMYCKNGRQSTGSDSGPDVSSKQQGYQASCNLNGVVQALAARRRMHSQQCRF